MRTVINCHTHYMRNPYAPHALRTFELAHDMHKGLSHKRTTCASEGQFHHGGYAHNALLYRTAIYTRFLLKGLLRGFKGYADPFCSCGRNG